MEQFSKREAITVASDFAKKNIKFFIPLFILILIISFSFDYLLKTLGKDNVVVGLILSILRTVIFTIFSLGMIKISLKILDNEEIKIVDIFSQYHLFIRYFLASIIRNLIVFVGFIFFIVPGVIFAIRFGFFDFLIVDKNMRIIESLKKSWYITKGNTLNLFLFYILLFLINVLGFFAFIVGLFFSVPLTIIAEAFVYRKLAKGLELIK